MQADEERNKEKNKEKEVLGAILWFLGWIPIFIVINLEIRDGGTPWASLFFVFVWAAYFFSRSNNDE